MKVTTILFCLLMSIFSHSQSFFVDHGQSANSVNISYNPDEFLSFTTVSFVSTIKSRIDVSPMFGYGSNSDFDQFAAGISVDYFALSQKTNSLPISLSLGIGYTLNQFGSKSFRARDGTFHLGGTRVALYHRVTSGKSSITPQIGYIYQVNLQDTDLKSGAFDLGLPLGFTLKNYNIVIIKPSVQFSDSFTFSSEDMQVNLQVGYLFGRTPIVPTEN